MELSGFRVSIHSDGEELKEHSVEVSLDGKKATCWVPSQSGKTFMVNYDIGDSSTIKDKAKAVYVYTDGRIMKRHASLPKKIHGSLKGVRTSDNTMRPFMFADVQRTDDDMLPDNICGNLDEMGSIRVQVYLAENWRPANSSSRKHIIQDHLPAVISEQAKKLIGHCVSLGDEKPNQFKDRCHMDYDPQKPDLVFEFQYRSVAMLQALGIIPPAKREAPPIIDIEDGDIMPHPKRQKFERNEDPMRSVQAELDRLRQRNRELEEKIAGPSGVKKEGIKCDPADIIDLT